MRILSQAYFNNLLFGRRYFVCLSVLIVALESVLLFLAKNEYLKFDGEITFLAFTAVPLFVITVFELKRNMNLQRGSFIKDYVSQFFTHVELYQTFHELIYLYTDDIFEKVENRMQEKKLDANVKNKPIFDIFEEFQNGRIEGSRFYHPALFQGSIEERKLDSLLGYFDVIAYYYSKGYLRIEDIVGSVGYFLSVMKSRKVISAYMSVGEDKWKETQYRKMGVTPPFSYLERLLADIETFNKKFEKHIKDLQSERL